MKCMSLVLFILCFNASKASFSQGKKLRETLPSSKLLLNDLSGFKPTSANWKIVGNIYASLHSNEPIKGSFGKGILANFSDKINRGHLFTRFEHGDIDIEMEIMMPKGSNSGIYLQGRYEVQLLDSWGKKDLKYSDMGGIYQRTDPSNDKGYEGHAPLINACKAPGLWQKLKIMFRAPDFDKNGKKIADARFLKVYLNGVIVQNDVAVSGPTRSSAFKDEQPTGPLMIQGNHGQIAIRNISYKLYGRKTVTFKNLVYTEYNTPGDSMKKLDLLKPLSHQKVDSISRYLATQKDLYLMKYQGQLEFPKAGVYLFTMQAGGGGLLVINNETVIQYDGAHSFDERALGQYKTHGGSVPFTLIYNKPQWREGFALYVEGEGIEKHPLHAKGSVFYEPEVAPILINPEPKKAVIQRSFMNSSNGKSTHCLSVGTPQGVHFTVDLETGNLFQIWDGGFLDATPMWHRRGNQQVARPLGPTIRFAEEPDFVPNHKTGTHPKFLEYTLDAKGLPEFIYTTGGMKLSEKLVPSAGERGITRKIRIDGQGDFSYILAKGSVIEKLSDSTFLVNDKEYYLILNTAALPLEIKNSGGAQSIVLSGKSSSHYEFEYTLLW